MKDWLDRKTLDIIQGTTMSIFQVNYKYVTDQGKLRNAATVVEAKDVNEARKLATPKIREEFDIFEITTVKTFGAPTPNNNK